MSRRQNVVSAAGERPNLSIGDHVTVRQPGLKDWAGEVIGIKPGAEYWAVDVRNADSIVWTLPAHRVRRS